MLLKEIHCVLTFYLFLLRKRHRYPIVVVINLFRLDERNGLNGPRLIGAGEHVNPRAMGGEERSHSDWHPAFGDANRFLLPLQTALFVAVCAVGALVAIAVLHVYNGTGIEVGAQGFLDFAPGQPGTSCLVSSAFLRPETGIEMENSHVVWPLTNAGRLPPL